MQFTPSLYRGSMVKYFLWAWRRDLTAAHSPEEFFGFSPQDMQSIHFHKQGTGEGAWFRLKDGRVIDKLAQARNTSVGSQMPLLHDAWMAEPAEHRVDQTLAFDRVAVDTICFMRKEELERRSAELKARMLAQKSEHSSDEASKGAQRKVAEKAKQANRSRELENCDVDDIQTLKRRVADLEAENKSLRQQIQMMAGRVNAPSRSSEDSVREQRHNFFKYSNLRRY